jgi:hypothetical protein
VSAADRIAKLEALLARVTERATAPRGAHVEEVPAYDMAKHDVAKQETPAPPSVDVDMDGDVTVEVVRQVSEPPVSIDVSDEEVKSSERVVVAQNLAEPESERRLSAAPPVAEAEALAEPAPNLPSEPEPEPAPEPEAAQQPEATPEPEPEPVREPDPEPEPPASSRRPIAVESNLADLAFGDAPPPEAPHTPPPESGRQVASTPVDLDFDGDFTGVRTREPDDGEVPAVGTPSPPPPPPESESPATAEGESVELAPPPVSAIASAEEVIVPILPETASAIFEGNAPAFKPTSFGELLDATLSL